MHVRTWLWTNLEQLFSQFSTGYSQLNKIQAYSSNCYPVVLIMKGTLLIILYR